MSNQYLTFDVTKSNKKQQLIIGRQGDSQLKFVSILFWDGEKNVPYDLTGKQVVFEALKPDNTHIVDYKGITILNAKGGLARYAFNEQVFAAAGTIQQAFFKITQTDSDNNVVTDSTLEISIKVLENKVEFGINSEDYLSEYDRLVAEVKKKFDNYAATVQDSVVKAQEIHDQIIEYTNLINSSAVITRAEFGEVSSIKQPVGTTAVDKLNSEFTDRGINVKWFGAIGDGIHDDSQAFFEAISYAVTNKKLDVYVPSGSYVISKPIDIPDKVNVHGSSDYSTVLLPRSLEYLVSLSAYSKFYNIQVNPKDNGKNIKVVSLSGQRTTLWSLVDNVMIMNGQDNFDTIGLYISPEGTSFDDLHSVYPNTFSNIYMYGVSHGILIDNKNFGFVNSNLFNNIHIRRYSKVGLTITSTGPNGQGVSNNNFDNIEIQAEPPVSTSTSLPIVITTGLHNRFNISTWQDSHFAVPSLTLKLDKFQAGNYSLRDNVFKGKFESGIDTTTDLAKINSLEGIELNEWIGTHFNGSISILKGSIAGDNKNILPYDLIDKEVDNARKGFPYLMNLIPAGGQGVNDVVFGIDDISSFIQIKDSGSLFIPIRGVAKDYVKNSKAFSVVFDFDISDDKESAAVIYPSFAYYNSTTGDKKPFNRNFQQGAKIGVSTYRTTMYVTPLSSDSTVGYDEFYASLTVNSVGTAKIRRVYIIGGVFSPNAKIKETHGVSDFKAVVKNANIIIDYKTIGLFVPKRGDTLVDFYQSYHEKLLESVDLDNGMKMITYPARF